MEEQTITLTETELQTKIDDAVKLATDKLISKHNGEMATIRKSYEDKIKQASMSAEEIAQQKAEELAQAQATELAELRTFKRSAIIKDKLTSAGLPAYFVNYARLLNAEEGDIDKVIKTVKGEYEATLPKGATHSTVVTNPSGNPQGGNGNDKQVAYDKMGDILKDVVS